MRERASRYGLILFLLVLPVSTASATSSGDSLTGLGTNLFDGLSNGAIWALIALGYTLVYGIIELINFAHGDLFMIGSFVSFGLFGTLGLTLATGTLGLALGLVVCADGRHGRRAASLNVMIERVAYKPLRNAPKLAPLITAGRLLLHPSERRHAVARRLAGRHPRPASMPSTSW